MVGKASKTQPHISDIGVAAVASPLQPSFETISSQEVIPHLDGEDIIALLQHLKLDIQESIRYGNSLMLGAISEQISTLSRHRDAQAVKADATQAYENCAKMGPYPNLVEQHSDFLGESNQAAISARRKPRACRDVESTRVEKDEVRTASAQIASCASDGSCDHKLPRTQTHLFNHSNIDDIRHHIIKNRLSKTSYNVHDLYYTGSFFGAIARHPYFESLTILVIVINAIWMGVDIDDNTATSLMDAKPIYVVADCFFMAYFFLEALIRFMAFEKKNNCCRDAWFMFDSAFVFLYFCDPFLIAIVQAISGHAGFDLPTDALRLLRLVRLSRLVRMMHSWPQLMTIVKSMVSALSAVGYTLALLLLLTYTFAIIMRSVVPVNSEIEASYFPNIVESFLSLIVYGLFLDSLADFVFDIKPESFACFVAAWAYVVCSSWMVLNMLIGVMCGVIGGVAAEQNENAVIAQLQGKFIDLLSFSDSDHKQITWQEFGLLLKLPEASRALESVNIDPLSLVQVAEDFFFDVDGDETTLTFRQVMIMIFDLRGDKQAKVKDVLSMGRRVTQKFIAFKDNFKSIECKIDKLLSSQSIS